MTRILVLMAAVMMVGCGTFHIRPVPPTPLMSSSGLMVMQGVNIQHERGGKARVRFAVEGDDDEPGHFGRNWGKYLSGAATVIIGDYLEDGEIDGYGIFDRGSDSDSYHCDSEGRTGEKIQFRGDDNRLSLHGESLSSDFVICVDGNRNTLSAQPAEPLQLLLLR